jgi:hypothetical protein
MILGEISVNYVELTSCETGDLSDCQEILHPYM